MSAERPFPPVHEADERTTLTALLDWYREGVVRKATGVAPVHGAAQPLGSPTSIAGLVKHLALVEDWWFTVRFEGGDPDARWVGVDFDADPDWEFNTAVDEHLEDLVAAYQEMCERSRAVTDRHSLDDVGADTSRYPFTMRFVLTHMLEETARHLGHMDILRELLDGTTGE